jgi:hypothetical protein
VSVDDKWAVDVRRQGIGDGDRFDVRRLTEARLPSRQPQPE